MDRSKILYSINVEDVQNVAIDQLGRTLDDEEIKLIEEKIGDDIDWHQALENTISSIINRKDKWPINKKS